MAKKPLLGVVAPNERPTFWQRVISWFRSKR